MKKKGKAKQVRKIERMKAVLRIPTTQYGYIEVEFWGTTQEIIGKHNEFVDKYEATVPKEELKDNEQW